MWSGAQATGSMKTIIFLGACSENQFLLWNIVCFFADSTETIRLATCFDFYEVIADDEIYSLLCDITQGF